MLRDTNVKIIWLTLPRCLQHHSTALIAKQPREVCVYEKDVRAKRGRREIRRIPQVKCGVHPSLEIQLTGFCTEEMVKCPTYKNGQYAKTSNASISSDV